MTTPIPVTPQIGPDLPGLPGVPASIGLLRCPTCDQRAARLHHVQDGCGMITPTLICQGCGSVFELEATAYNIGLGAGVLAEKARWEADAEFPATRAGGHALVIEYDDDQSTARCQCGEPFGQGNPAGMDHAGLAWEQHMKTEATR